MCKNGDFLLQPAPAPVHLSLNFFVFPLVTLSPARNPLKRSYVRLVVIEHFIIFCFLLHAFSALFPYLYICIYVYVCMFVCVVDVLSFFVFSPLSLAMKLPLLDALFWVRAAVRTYEFREFQAFCSTSTLFVCMDVLCSLHIGLCDATVLIGFVFDTLFFILSRFFSQNGQYNTLGQWFLNMYARGFT